MMDYTLTDFLIRMAIILECHFVGDYVLQGDYLARTKCEFVYNMFVHCFLYCLPFAVAFWFDWRLLILFGTHIVIDTLKARYHKISYLVDQILHLVICAMYFWGLYPVIDY